MGFEEFLPEYKEEDKVEIKEKLIEKITPNQVYDVITSKKSDWQAIIYDLIHTEQLDPWDLDIVILTRKYFEKIEQLNEYYISSKVLLALALLLRIKSEFLLNKHIRSIDEILFGKKPIEINKFEKIEIDPIELPILVPKTPLSRLRKVTLSELITALDKAINTESRRIKRVVQLKRAKKLSEVDIPTFKRIDLKDRIKQLYSRILNALRPKQNKPEKISFSKLIGTEKEEKISTFLPLLHLSNSKKLWLEQNGHLDEIYIYLFEYFEKNRDNLIEDLEQDIEEMKQELSMPSEDFEKSGLEKAREKLLEKKILKDEARKELIKELGEELKELNLDEDIEKLTGFEDE